jgi:hypothetical protein
MTQHDELPAAAIATLSRKRAEIVGKIAALQRQVADLRSDLLHIDYTLRMIDPNFSPDTKAARVRFSTIGYFERGELSLRIYEGLRRSGSITAAELTDRAMTEKKLTDHRVRAYFVSRFLSRLAGMAKDGKIERIRDGFSVRWKLADSPHR